MYLTAVPPSGSLFVTLMKLRRLEEPLLSSAQICHVPKGSEGSNSAPPVVPGTFVTKPAMPSE